MYIYLSINTFTCKIHMSAYIDRHVYWGSVVVKQCSRQGQPPRCTAVPPSGGGDGTSRMGANVSWWVGTNGQGPSMFNYSFCLRTIFITREEKLSNLEF